ncbi:MAG: hypothetical protein JWM68_1559 [Verrucomicrobiales bacterium]|nr:hypothetical protein [Verrucomicrobiales bacterium]
MQEIRDKGEGLDLDNPVYEYGKRVKVDLSVLIRQIYVAPTSPDWVFELVGKVTRSHGLNCPIVKSNPYTDPLI